MILGSNLNPASKCESSFVIKPKGVGSTLDRPFEAENCWDGVKKKKGVGTPFLKSTISS